MPDTVVAPWRFFVVQVAGLRRLGPSFLRVTFTGDDLHRFADNGWDQRVKLAFPESPAAVAHLPEGTDWYLRWRDLPAEVRSPIRTYTVRALRPALRELDVDLVLHGGADQGGPACRWARRARIGDRLAVLGPEAGHGGDHGGIGFRLPAALDRLLLAGDETAVPAVSAILERLPADARGTALLEVPHPDDVQELHGPAGMAVRWLVRYGRPPGSELDPAVRQAAADRAPGYAWLAGEAGVVTGLRRHLVTERGIDRGAVTFMGYWRQDRAAQAAA